MVYEHAYLNTLLLSLLHSTFMLSVVKMLLKGEVGGQALNSHGNYIVDHGRSWKKSWNCVFEFLWEPCNIHRILKQLAKALIRLRVCAG